MPNKELQLYSCKYVMDTALQKTPFIVDRLLAPGLYVLAGAPKVGKSWLVLDLCLSVAEGQDFLGHRTEKGQVVYLALEDSLIRLQNRVYEFTDEPTENLDFALLADSIEPYKRDMFAFAVHDLMLDERSFIGSATALCDLLNRKYGGQYFANRVTRDLIQHTDELASLGVKFTWRRSHGSRIIKLEYDRAGAGNLALGCR